VIRTQYHTRKGWVSLADFAAAIDRRHVGTPAMQVAPWSDKPEDVGQFYHGLDCPVGEAARAPKPFSVERAERFQDEDIDAPVPALECNAPNFDGYDDPSEGDA